MQQAVPIPEKKNEGAFRELISEVLENTPNPEDKYEVAAALESIGWNDSMAKERFGYRDVFDLGEEIFNVIRRDILYSPISRIEKLSTAEYILRVIRSFLRGLIFALPMAVSATAMLTLRFSLWSYENFTLAAATSISIGTIMSFVVVGGFIQSLARFGFLYLGQGYINMARRSVYYFVRVGAAAVIILAAAFFVFNWLFSIYPWEMSVVIIIYHLFLSGIWLSVTVMYILQKELVFTGLITVGIILVFILFKLAGLNIIIAQLISLSIVAVLGVFIAHSFFLKAEEKKKGQEIEPALPRKSIIFFKSFSYFKYGAVYFFFLNIDRLIAWSAESAYMPYVVWFRGEYELGLDFALLALIIPMGLIEVVANEIMVKISCDQKNYGIDEIPKMNSLYKSFYYRRFFMVMLFCLVNSFLIYSLIWFLESNKIIHLSVLTNSTTLFVFIAALIGYSLLSLGLMNTLILFSLSQPEGVSRSMLLGFGLNILIGFVLSRWFDYSWAVLGMVLGALIFTALTFRWVDRVMSDLDYYLYTAQ